jgi:plasmid stabilization system protein ParE
VRVTWSPLADGQLDDAVAFIAADNPDSGLMVPETQREDIREVLVRPYRAMYRRRDGVVEIEQ